MGRVTTRFHGIGQRKAVAMILREAGRPMTTAKIHAELIAGGIIVSRSKSGSLLSNARSMGVTRVRPRVWAYIAPEKT